jgi:hypothetical protein
LIPLSIIFQSPVGAGAGLLHLPKFLVKDHVKSFSLKMGNSESIQVLQVNSVELLELPAQSSPHPEGLDYVPSAKALT